MNVPFNLALSEAQQQARAQVPLPYAHEGMSVILDLTLLVLIAMHRPTADVEHGRHPVRPRLGGRHR